jgi:hypothetical protein
MRNILGYEQALQLKIYEGQLVWSRSESMLVVNTILLGAISIFLSYPNPNELVLIILSIFGFFLCLIWLEASIRGFAFNKFWTYCARELEESSKDVKLLTKGNNFKNNRTIEFNFKDREGLPFQYRRPYLGRLFPTDTGLYFLIVIFTLMYVGLFILCLSHNIVLISAR